MWMMIKTHTAGVKGGRTRQTGWHARALAENHVRRCDLERKGKPSHMGKSLDMTGFLAERMGFEPMCDCSQTDFECCKTLADSRLEQVVSGHFVKRQKRRRRKGLRTFRPVSARGDSNRPKVQIKPCSCVKSLRSCAFARSQARKQRPRQRQ